MKFKCMNNCIQIRIIMELNVDTKKLHPKSSLAKIRSLSEFSANFKKISKIISNYNPTKFHLHLQELLKLTIIKDFQPKIPKS